MEIELNRYRFTLYKYLGIIDVGLQFHILPMLILWSLNLNVEDSGTQLFVNLTPSVPTPQKFTQF